MTSSSGKKCTLIPPATHLEILDAMMRPKAGIKENEDFTIEFNFKYFGQSDGEGSVLSEKLQSVPKFHVKPSKHDFHHQKHAIYGFYLR